ncbi:MAG TPA: trehalose-phosphatase [Longimicrobium sp.]|nr:trehalose-phosphatase [Longimicrobium sp.]
MRHILAAAQRDVLRQFARANVLLAFDFDGTLAPIVPRPEDARMRRRTRELLSALAEVYPCAVISGRVHEDVAARLEGIPVHVVGNHGLDPRVSTTSLTRRVAGWKPALEALQAEHAGVWVEDKRFSVAIHYRKSREKKRVLAAIRQVVAGLEEARVVYGKQVVNLLPPGAPDKGTALEALRGRLRCDTALYVGDDTTDEDIFARGQPGQLLSIRVGRSAKSHAAFFLEEQRELDALLDLLLEERADGAARAGDAVAPSVGTAAPGRDVLSGLWAASRLLFHAAENGSGVAGLQRMMLRLVGRFPGISPGRAAEELRVPPSVLAGTLAELEKRRLLRRRPDPRDGRRALLELTVGGREALAGEEVTVEARVDTALAPFSPEELDTFQRVLESLVKGLAPDLAAPGKDAEVAGRGRR